MPDDIMFWVYVSAFMGVATILILGVMDMVSRIIHHGRGLCSKFRGFN